MTSIQLNKELPEEFFSDVLITAFDGAYGSAWEWFEPVDNNWLRVKKVHEGQSCTDDIWVSAKVRLKDDYETGHPLFDAPEGFIIDHAAIAGGISRIVNDDYLDVWRPATPSEEDAIDNNSLSREWRSEAGEHGTVYMVHTGETGSSVRSYVTRAVQDVDAGDIDASAADCIVQAAAFGKVIFG